MKTNFILTFLIKNTHQWNDTPSNEKLTYSPQYQQWYHCNNCWEKLKLHFLDLINRHIKVKRLKY